MGKRSKTYAEKVMDDMFGGDVKSKLELKAMNSACATRAVPFVQQNYEVQDSQEAVWLQRMKDYTAASIPDTSQDWIDARKRANDRLTNLGTLAANLVATSKPS
jgi:hypothetical protein